MRSLTKMKGGARRRCCICLRTRGNFVKTDCFLSKGNEPHAIGHKKCFTKAFETKKSCPVCRGKNPKLIALESVQKTKKREIPERNQANRDGHDAGKGENENENEKESESERESEEEDEEEDEEGEESASDNEASVWETWTPSSSSLTQHATSSSSSSNNESVRPVVRPKRRPLQILDSTPSSSRSNSIIRSPNRSPQRPVTSSSSSATTSASPQMVSFVATNRRSSSVRPPTRPKIRSWRFGEDQENRNYNE